MTISWAAPLYDHEHRVMKEAYRCPVTNIYGSREVGHIAGVCPEGSLHINMEDILLEIEDKMHREPSSNVGEILVTTLNLTPMPFIRYRIGDVGEIASSDCACGRRLDVLKKFVGRTGEIFVTIDGRMISPNFWMRTFMVGGQSQSVERFQIVYRASDSILIRLVRRPNFSEETEADLRRHLQKNFSPLMKVELEYVPKIERHASGKELLIVNQLNQRSEEQ